VRVRARRGCTVRPASVAREGARRDAPGNTRRLTLVAATGATERARCAGRHPRAGHWRGAQRRRGGIEAPVGILRACRHGLAALTDGTSLRALA
jgi:hypothetical protein